jgi:hypothetical protein
MTALKPALPASVEEGEEYFERTLTWSTREKLLAQPYTQFRQSYVAHEYHCQAVDVAVET